MLCKLSSFVIAGAGIHSRRKHESRGERDRSPRPRNSHYTVFYRLPEGFKGAPPELGKLIQKKHPVMGKAHFPRFWIGAPAYEPGV